VQFIQTILEVKNIGAAPVELSRLTFVVNGRSSAVAGADGISVAPGEEVSVTSSTGGGADFQLVDLVQIVPDGGTLELLVDGVSVDTVDVDLVANLDAGPGLIPLGAFPARTGSSMQLDADRTTATDNDDGNNWCLSFRANSSFGAPNHPCRRAAVINEFSYDGPGVDDGTTFVEIAAPIGALITDLAIVERAPNDLTRRRTLITGERVGRSGLYVVADTDIAGDTDVSGADQLEANFDPQNGDDDGVALADGSVILDALGYGENAVGVAEGAPAADPTPLSGGHVFSLARDENSSDTGDNAADFVVCPLPTPGSANVVPEPAVRVDPDVIVAFEDTDVFVFVTGGGAFGGDEPELSVGGVVLDCVYVEHDGDDAVFFCTVPARNGSSGARRQLPEALFADVSVVQPGALGGDTITNTESLLIEEGSANESDLDIEADFCNIQFPTDDIQVALGDPTRLIFSQFFENGLTNATNGGPAPGVLVEFGLSRNDSPQSLSDFVFAPGPVFNVEANNGSNDEYRHSFTPTTQGTFRFLFRYSLDGGLNWTACDEDGAGSNDALDLNIAAAGTIVVGPPSN
jgi:hypothetical protein